MRYVQRRTAIAGIIAASMLVSACSSDDDDDGGSTEGSTAGETTGGEGEGTSGESELNENLETVSLMLDSNSTVPPANVEGAVGEGSFSVDTETGAISGSVTVSGTTGVPTMAHIHRGAVGEAGEVVVGLEGSEDMNTWSVPEGEALDAAGIADFEAGNLYVNVHTDANGPGELRAQLVDDSNALPAPGSLTMSFRNTSDTQFMTPPVVILHNAPGTENGIRWFEAGQPASAEVAGIAENGDNPPLVMAATGQISAGTVTAVGVAFVDAEAPGPVLPGEVATVTLDLEAPDQVLSVVSMVLCTNDGFSGIDSRALSADTTETFFAPVYDAGSEVNVEMLNYWVPPCGGEGNLHDDEGGAITIHPGQASAENPDFNFPAASELLEITVTRN